MLYNDGELDVVDREQVRLAYSGLSEMIRARTWSIIASASLAVSRNAAAAARHVLQLAGGVPGVGERDRLSGDLG